MRIELLLFLTLACKVESNWDITHSDPAEANMGFTTFNMKCNDDETVCHHSFTMHVYGRLFLISTAYMKNPFKFQLNITEGGNNWKIHFAQGDQSEEYRWCDNAFSRSSIIRYATRFVLCVGNSFTGISVPDDCPKPVTLVDLDNHNFDEKIRGQQMLYCLS
ncbi:uncharacterized protein LOC110977459 [Acanthaster planci]|uniref:Uncharacterized protein LOC110977459 n=1 Tax=Acanthaster planci TaxID=133434 RepID=A0A8B7Y2C0_ACAPL|nr:uncharacterized protein LOC110977459 [Acanthaster planci]